jgi:hypothetical protein
MKISSLVSLTGPAGNGDGECFSIPVPVYPPGEEFLRLHTRRGRNFSYAFPNGGISHGESGFGSPLPSLLVSEFSFSPFHNHHSFDVILLCLL